VAVAMTHLGGVQAPVVVATAVVVVTVEWMTRVSGAVAGAYEPLVPMIVTAVVDEGELLETAIESVEVIVYGGVDGGVTGLGLNPPVTPAGKFA
jgi:hypothetical protein